MRNSSLILIGMPGSGKSTLGAALAQQLNKEFIDTDLLIEHKTNTSLQTIVNEQGYRALHKIEEEAILSQDYPHHIVATGGSSVYSKAAMQHLEKFGPVIFLDVPVTALLGRIHNMDSRGIAHHPGQTFEALFVERRILYTHYADIVINCEGKSPTQIIDDILSNLSA